MGGPSATASAVAAVLWLLLGVVPGLLVATFLAPQRSRLDRLAVAPLVSIALGFAPASWLSALGVPQAWQAAWIVPLLVAVALLVVLGRRGDLAPLFTWTPTSGAVVIALLVAGAGWLIGIAASPLGFTAVPPDQDGGSHGVFVARILVSGSMSPDRVAVFDLADPGAHSVFYPLGIHSLAAPVAALSSIPSALLVAMTLFSSGAMVVGTAALGRRVGGTRLVLPAALISGVMTPWFPVGLAFWGAVPLLVGVSTLPGLLLALLDARRRADVLLAAVGAAGMLALHTTEALVAVAMAAATMVVAGRHDSRRDLGPLVVAVGLGAVVVAPLVVGLLGGGAVRAQEAPRSEGLVSMVLWALLRYSIGIDARHDAPAWAVAASMLAAVAVSAVAVTGVVHLRRSALGRVVSGTVALCLVLGALARGGLLLALTTPWYGNPERLAAQAASLLPVLVAAGLLVLWDRAAVGAERRVLTVVGTTIAAVLVVQWIAGATDTLARYPVVTSDDRAAYAWLAAHVAPGERVLNDHRDGSLWVYEATRGAVAPVFGPKPSGAYADDPFFTSRVDLRDRLLDVGTDQAVRAEADALTIRYVLVGARRFDGAAPLLDAEAMAASPAFREVFRSGDARVFEIVGG